MLFTIKRGTHTNRGGNPHFFDVLMPLFRQNCLNAAAGERWHPHAVLLLRIAADSKNCLGECNLIAPFTVSVEIIKKKKQPTKNTITGYH